MPQSPASSTRERILATTEEMLRESGMSGIGIKDVVARGAAPIGSLYHYFPGGKTQLVAESLRNHAEKLPRLVERFFDGKRSVASAVHAFFDAAAVGFEQAGATKGCAIGAVTLDLAPDDIELATICRDAFDAWVDAIAKRLPFSHTRTRRSFAVTIVAALEGAFVLSRATRDGRPFRDAGRCLSSMLSTVAAGAPDRRRSKQTSRRE